MNRTLRLRRYNRITFDNISPISKHEGALMCNETQTPKFVHFKLDTGFSLKFKVSAADVENILKRAESGGDFKFKDISENNNIAIVDCNFVRAIWFTEC